jgi:hypothetical protein
MQTVTLTPEFISNAMLRYDLGFYFALPFYVVEKTVETVINLFRYYFIDWHNRVDAVWGIEMISATCALVMSFWMLFGKAGAAGRSVTVSIPAVAWFCALVVLCVLQFRSAIWGQRKHRALGCVMASAMWLLLIRVIWIRAGFAFVQAPFIAIEIACLAACMAYYVSPQPPQNR